MIVCDGVEPEQLQWKKIVFTVVYFKSMCLAFASIIHRFNEYVS